MAGTVVAGQRLQSSLLGVPNWTAMTLANGWTNAGGGSANCQYRLWVLLNSVEIIGHSTAGTITSGTTIATLPNGPASAQNMDLNVTAGAIAAPVKCVLSITTAGLLQVINLPAGTTQIAFHDWYSLDA